MLQCRKDTEHRPAARRLHPHFDVRGSKMLTATQFMAAVPRGRLRNRVSSLQRHAASVLDAIDFLHQGW
jgi:hypothetical protein